MRSARRQPATPTALLIPPALLALVVWVVLFLLAEAAAKFPTLGR